ncbi:type VI secretion protein, partial [Streptomyces sp. NPDC013489]
MDTARKGGGGVSDGLLLSLFGLLLCLTVLVWTATGLAGLLSHGGWPQGVALTGTPSALRSLVTAPTDLAAAWPATPPGELSGYGLFWGLLIGEAMILFVLAIFALGTLARWRAVRAHRKAGVYGKDEPPVRATRESSRERPDYDERPYERRGYDEAPYARPGYEERSYDKHGYDEHGYEKPGYDEPSHERPAPGDPAQDRPVREEQPADHEGHDLVDDLGPAGELA